jgi:hypothetical protein
MCVKIGGGGHWEAISSGFGEVSHRAIGHRLEVHKGRDAEPNHKATEPNR